MANLKFSLEAILNEEQDITIDDLLRGLSLVHENASTILEELTAAEAAPIPGLPERRIPQILRSMAAEQNAFHSRLCAAT
jgi:hypothetical protein